jgi:hypothetical protein
VCQGFDNVCGMGFILHFFSIHFIVGRDNIGGGTYNKGDFMALFFLLKCVSYQNVLEIKSFGDLNLTIYWMSGNLILENMDHLLTGK